MNGDQSEFYSGKVVFDLLFTDPASISATNVSHLGMIFLESRFNRIEDSHGDQNLSQQLSIELFLYDISY